MQGEKELRGVIIRENMSRRVMKGKRYEKEE